MTGIAARVQEVPAETTFALRQQVLRPHQRPEDLALPGDEDSATVHFATLDESGDVIGTVRVQPARCPWVPDRADAWQLRAMATAERARGQGIGAELVRRVIAHVAGHGGGLLWCKAREAAEGFYRRAGFSSQFRSDGATGEYRWDEPPIGPHVAMLLPVPPRGLAT